MTSLETSEPVSPVELREDSPACPLCGRTQTMRKAKTLYGHTVCSKCYYGFANRRQGAYLLDSIVWSIVVFPITFAFFFLLVSNTQILNSTPGMVAYYAIIIVLGIFFALIFALKDSFRGHSPFKAVFGVQVVDSTTFEPITVKQSFKRNVPHAATTALVGNIPVVGSLASLGIYIVLAVQLCKGYRWGDKWANTRVIWKKYAASPVFTMGHHCSACGYDLRAATQPSCPECGHAIAANKLAYIRKLFATSAPMSENQPPKD